MQALGDSAENRASVEFSSVVGWGLANSAERGSDCAREVGGPESVHMEGIPWGSELVKIDRKVYVKCLKTSVRSRLWVDCSKECLFLGKPVVLLGQVCYISAHQYHFFIRVMKNSTSIE